MDLKAAEALGIELPDEKVEACGSLAVVNNLRCDPEILTAVRVGMV